MVVALRLQVWQVGRCWWGRGDDWYCDFGSGSHSD